MTPFEGGLQREPEVKKPDVARHNPAQHSFKSRIQLLVPLLIQYSLIKPYTEGNLTAIGLIGAISAQNVIKVPNTHQRHV
jgi:hypothetical protein